MRWVVERTFGWLNRARRLSKDFEATIESALAWLMAALAFLLMRRQCRLVGLARSNVLRPAPVLDYGDLELMRRLEI